MTNHLPSELLCSLSDSQEGVDDVCIPQTMISSGKWCSDVNGTCDYTHPTEMSHDASLTSDDGSASSLPMACTGRLVSLLQIPSDDVPESQRESVHPQLQLRPTELGKVAKTIGKIEKPITHIHKLVEAGVFGWEKPEWVLTCPLRQTEIGDQAKSLGELRPRAFNIKDYENQSILRAQKTCLTRVQRDFASESFDATHQEDGRLIDTTCPQMAKCGEHLEDCTSFNADTCPNDAITFDPPISGDKVKSDLRTEVATNLKCILGDRPSPESGLSRELNESPLSKTEESEATILEKDVRALSDCIDATLSCVGKVVDQLTETTSTFNATEGGSPTPAKTPSVAEVLEYTSPRVDGTELLNQNSTACTPETTDHALCQSPVINPFLKQVQLKSAKRDRPRARYAGFMNDIATHIEALYD